MLCSTGNRRRRQTKRGEHAPSTEQLASTTKRLARFTSGIPRRTQSIARHPPQAFLPSMRFNNSHHLHAVITNRVARSSRRLGRNG